MLTPPLNNRYARFGEIEEEASGRSGSNKGKKKKSTRGVIDDFNLESDDSNHGGNDELDFFLGQGGFGNSKKKSKDRERDSPPTSSSSSSRPSSRSSNLQKGGYASIYSRNK